MADNTIASGSIEISADMTAYDRAMADLPSKSKAKIASTMQAIQAEMARTKLDIKVASGMENGAERGATLQRLSAVQDQLRAKMAAVQDVAISQAEAFRKMTAEAKAAAAVKKQLADAEKAQAAAGRAAAATANAATGAANKAAGGFKNMGMGVLFVSQAIEDAQYGFCLPAGTMIHGPDGSRVPIEDVRPGDTASSLVGGKISAQKIVAVADSGVKPTVAIVTESGRRITPSASHPLLTPHGWREAGSLSIGDRLRAVGDDGSLAWDSVAGIEPGATERTYDLQMDGEPNFVANGFVAHNSAIVNNIPGIVMAFGGTGGLAGGVSIASVGINMLIKNWDKLQTAFGQSKTLTAAEEMEVLRKKTELTADEAERLNRADKTKGAIGELRGAQTKDQQTESQAVTEAITEAGFRNVVKSIQEKAPDLIDSTGTALEAKNKLDEALKSQENARATAGESDNPYLVKEADDRVTRARKALADARDATAETIVAQGKLPAEWAGQREKLADIFKGTKLGTKLTEADPDMIRQKEDEDARNADNLEHQNRMAEFQNQGLALQDQRAQEFAGNASPAARKFVLDAQVAGKAVDQAKLGELIGKDLAKAGVKQDDVEALSTKTAEALDKSMTKQVEDLAAKNGTSKQSAAKAELQDLKIEQQQRISQSIQTNLANVNHNIREAKVVGSDEFAKSLLSAGVRSKDDLLQKQLDASQKAVANLEEIKRGILRGLPTVMR